MKVGIGHQTSQTKTAEHFALGNIIVKHNGSKIPLWGYSSIG